MGSDKIKRNIAHRYKHYHNSVVPSFLTCTSRYRRTNSLFLIFPLVSLQICVCGVLCDTLWNRHAELLILTVTGQSQWNTPHHSLWLKKRVCSYSELEELFFPLTPTFFFRFSFCFVILLATELESVD